MRDGFEHLFISDTFSRALILGFQLSLEIQANNVPRYDFLTKCLENEAFVAFLNKNSDKMAILAIAPKACTCYMKTKAFLCHHTLA